MMKQTFKNIDLTATADKSSAKHTTMFEVNDSSGRENEYGSGAGSSYIRPFAQFIESLGFEIPEEVISYRNTCDITINGVKFWINAESASYKTKGAYGNKVEIRKPENRFVALKEAGYQGKTIFRIHFNEEYEVQRLKDKINDAIKAHYELQKKHAEFEQSQTDNMVAVAMHYLEDPYLKALISEISCQDTQIIFTGRDNQFSVRLNPNGILSVATLNIPDMKTMSQIYDLCIQASARAEFFRSAAKIIWETVPLPDYLQEWAAKKQYMRFSIETMSVK